MESFAWVISRPCGESSSVIRRPLSRCSRVPSDGRRGSIRRGGAWQAGRRRSGCARPGREFVRKRGRIRRKLARGEAHRGVSHEFGGRHSPRLGLLFGARPLGIREADGARRARFGLLSGGFPVRPCRFGIAFVHDPVPESLSKRRAPAIERRLGRRDCGRSALSFEPDSMYAVGIHIGSVPGTLVCYQRTACRKSAEW